MPRCFDVWLQGQHVLIVEDETLIATLLIEIFEDRGGIPVGLVDTHRNALRLISEACISVAIMDTN